MKSVKDIQWEAVTNDKLNASTQNNKFTLKEFSYG